MGVKKKIINSPHINEIIEGMRIGRVLEIIEEEWINNTFKISKERVNEIIRLNVN